MSAMAARRPNRGLAGGWLSMAPEPEAKQDTTQPQKDTAHHKTSTSPRSPSRRAVFQVGQDDDNDIDTPVTPQSDQGSSSFMAPAFDVRSSFAPMTFKRPPPQSHSQPTSSNQHNPQHEPQPSTSAGPSKPIEIVHSSSSAKHSSVAYLHTIEDDGLGIEYGGRKWKGKTAHAVEQEMEMAGDTTVMSYAPDAVYLASRLEGLRRNLEAGGDAARGRRWLGSETDDLTSSESQDSQPPSSSRASAPLSPRSPSRPRTPDDRIPASLPPHITDFIPAAQGPSDSSALEPLDPAAKAAALESRVEIRLLRRSDLEQVRELHCLHGDYDRADVDHYVTSAAFLLRLLVDESHVCLVAVAKPIPAPVEPFPSRDAMPHQSHHSHGAHHGVPRCPPPSMDMPPSSAAYVFASKGIASNSPFLGPTTRVQKGGDSSDAPSSKRRRRQDTLPPPAASSSLGRHTPVLGSMLEEHEEEEDEGDNDDDETSSTTSQSRSTPSSLSARLDDIDMSDDAGGASVTDAARLSASEGTTGETSISTSLLAPSTNVPLSPFPKTSKTQRGGLAPLQHSTTGGDSSSATSPLSLSSSGMAPGREYSTADMILAGPTNEVAPPRALRVMIPPAPGAPMETETILGVASAQVILKPPTESLWGDSDPSSSQPHKEIHILTLSVAKAERGLGLGGKLFDQLIEEAMQRNVGAAYRAAMGRRSQSSALTSQALSTRIYLEVHTGASSKAGDDNGTVTTSSHAVRLYKSRGFEERQRLQGFFRGDARIPAAVRSMPGGNDALLMERWVGR